MKPIFGIDITTDKNNEQMAADNFVAVAASKETAEKLEDSGNKAENTLKKAQLPLGLSILRYVALVIGGIGILSFLNSFSELGFAAAYAASPLLFFAGIIGVVIFVALSVIETVKQKSVLDGEQAADIVNEIESVTATIYRELGVPTEAADVDVLLFRYKESDNGEIVPKEPMLGATAYINFEVKAFIDNNNLCLADLNYRYDFPMNAMSCITPVNKKISVPTWNKTLPITDETFKDYHLTKNSMDCIVVRSYYILEMIIDDEKYGIYFPAYELEAFKKLTGLRPIEDNE